MVEPVLAERLQVAELHATDVAGEELISWQAGSVVLLLVLDVGGSVSVTLSTLVALERLVLAAAVAATTLWRVVAAGGLATVLEDGVLLQQPGAWEGCQADGALDEAALGQLVGTRNAEQLRLLLQERIQRHRYWGLTCEQRKWVKRVEHVGRGRTAIQRRAAGGGRQCRSARAGMRQQEAVLGLRQPVDRLQRGKDLQTKNWSCD